MVIMEAFDWINCQDSLHVDEWYDLNGICCFKVFESGTGCKIWYYLCKIDIFSTFVSSLNCRIWVDFSGTYFCFLCLFHLIITELLVLPISSASVSEICEIPESIRFCKNLQVVDFSSNPLSRWVLWTGDVIVYKASAFFISLFVCLFDVRYDFYYSDLEKKKDKFTCLFILFLLIIVILIIIWMHKNKQQLKGSHSSSSCIFFKDPLSVKLFF